MYKEMKVIICGGRDFNDYGRLEYVLDFNLQNFDKKELEIVHGDCKSGADLLAKKYAESRGYKIMPFPADWDKYKKAAGPIRNSQMAEYGNVCIAFWDGKSKGTCDMIKKALSNGLKTKIVRY